MGRWCRGLSLVVVALLLAGCGGAGGNPPKAPVSGPVPQSDQQLIVQRMNIYAQAVRTKDIGSVASSLDDVLTWGDLQGAAKTYSRFEIIAFHALEFGVENYSQINLSQIQLVFPDATTVHAASHWRAVGARAHQGGSIPFDYTLELLWTFRKANASTWLISGLRATRVVSCTAGCHLLP